MKKKPHLKETPLTKKEPRTAINPEAFKRLNPSWRVALVELVDPFGWHKATEAELRAVHQRLSSFETMTWEEILFPPRKNHHNHQIAPHKICRDARDRLESMDRAGVDLLTSLHVKQKERICGILDGAVLHVLWWDPEHLIYPVEQW